MALSPLKNWQYPVAVKNKNNANTRHYYRALMLAESGFYLVSIGKQLHPAIHFDKKVLQELGAGDNSPISCLADGEVVAYRVNDHYPMADYGNKVAFFSTGFVLVRHMLEMAPVLEKRVETANKFI
jgi:hypothetical protein